MLLDPQTIAQTSSLGWLENASLALIEDSLVNGRTGKTAVVSSFGAESAVLLHLVSRIKRDAPVIFIDTRMIFQETLDYQIKLSEHLELEDVRVVSASAEQMRREDVFARLHLKNPDACCHLRKVAPLEDALSGFDAWINGRKRHQSTTRSSIRPIEAEGNGRLKVNPLLHWDRDDILSYIDLYKLPRHPLVKQGFTSIGCAPCTAKPGSGGDVRSGRWQDQEKVECGIHFENGAPVRVIQSVNQV